MPIYRFSESGTFSVLVEVRAENEEEAREHLDNGEGEEVEGTLEYFSPSFRLESITWSEPMTMDYWRKLKDYWRKLNDRLV